MGRGILTGYEGVSVQSVVAGVTDLCADPLLHHEGRSGHVVQAVLDVGLGGGGASDDADHRHLQEGNRETQGCKTPSRTNKPQLELELVQLEHRSHPIPAEGEPFFFSLQCVFLPLGVSE